MVAFEHQIAEVIACVESGKSSEILGGDLARDAIQLCHQQTKSLASRQPVTI